jgi:hypothetical protein
MWLPKRERAGLVMLLPPAAAVRPRRHGLRSWEAQIERAIRNSLGKHRLRKALKKWKQAT